jgi:hypothetical protein
MSNIARHGWVSLTAMISPESITQSFAAVSKNMYLMIGQPKTDHF